MPVSLSFDAVRAADPAVVQARWRLGVEVDPVPFFMQGYSVHVAAEPPSVPELRLTLGSFGLRTGPVESGENAGFTARQWAVEMSAQYTLFDVWHGGLWAGVYVFTQHWLYTRSDTPGEAVGNWITPAPAVGFRLMPYKSGPYIVPWAALGFPLLRADRPLGSHAYHEPALSPVLAVHVGWAFEL